METIEQTKLILESFIKETYSDADIAPGSVLSELLVKLTASSQNENNNRFLSIDQGNSINDALSSADDTYSEAIDEVASNYNVVRNEGIKSGGSIRVFVSRMQSYTINDTLVFLQSNLNLNYLPIRRYTVRENATDDEIKIYTLSGNVHYFDIEVEAEDVGENYQLSQGTKLALGVNQTLNNFIEATVLSNFSTGQSRETDKQLITRYKQGLAAGSLNNKTSIDKFLTENYIDYQTLSIIGSNDIGMTRSYKYGFNTFGMSDVYVRSSLAVARKQILLPATKITNSTWQIDLSDVDEVAGFYDVAAIRSSLSTYGTLTIVSKTYSVKPTSTNYTNSVNTVQEARFSKYQGCVVVFQYIDADANLEEKDFYVEFVYLPNIYNIQNNLLSAENKIICADFLVKAVVPCFVNLSLKLYKRKEFLSEHTALIKQDIFNYINNIDFNTSLDVSQIIDICHNYPVKKVDLPLNLEAFIFAPNNDIITITDSDSITISDEYVDKGVTTSNCLFFIDYYKQTDDGNISDNIGIEIV